MTLRTRFGAIAPVSPFSGCFFLAKEVSLRENIKMSFVEDYIEEEIIGPINAEGRRS